MLGDSANPPACLNSLECPRGAAQRHAYGCELGLGARGFSSKSLGSFAWMTVSFLRVSWPSPIMETRVSSAEPWINHPRTSL